MKKIGGFFELEIANGNSLFHDEAIKLSTGRACLNYVLQVIKPIKVYVPFYCCDALFEPMILNKIEYEFYKINENLEIENLPDLKPNELIIYCDFFGVKSSYTQSLISIYGNKLIIDNSHSFYQKQQGDNNVSFTTARKYFGVPDGAFLYMPNNYKVNKPLNRNTKVSIKHNVNSLLGLQDLAYSEFTKYEKSLNSNIDKISIISEKILKTVNYKMVREIRNKNFDFYRKEFHELNTLKIEKNEEDCFCYPLLLETPINKTDLFKDKIYIPSYWNDTTKRSNSSNFKFETKISNQLLPLPIDHRYDENDLRKVVEVIKNKIIDER